MSVIESNSTSRSWPWRRRSSRWIV